MPDFKNLEEVQAVLEQSINDYPTVPSLLLRVGNGGGKQLDLRIEFDQQKKSFPIAWTLHPKRGAFADEKKRKSFTGIFAAPQIPDLLADDLRKWGINHADLNGRLFIATLGLHIDRSPRKIRYKNPENEPKLFTGKASRIARALLYQKRKSWTQDELQAFTETSPGYVSRLLNALEDAAYLQKTGPGTRTAPAIYKVSDPDGLLDAWVQADDFRKRVQIYEYSVLSSSNDQIARDTLEAIGRESIAFTQWYAAWLRRAHTTPPIVSAYVGAEVIKRFKLGRSVDSGGNLWLIVPKDEGVFQGIQQVKGFPLVSDPQIYLDLIKSGQRGPEAAEELRKSPSFARSPGEESETSTQAKES
ncbi:type IV toxin-antitoxin system AbiEi family antitoxin [Pelagicoccus enzymogenes]|uniref:type IV toxin-antitoxin system AbiEi family antitoxin n=1 Tax=Pelagicoccus enzymogenes TaxID=2773457 RepID=UPI00280C4AB4|nr:type IV toxin-antitoxin system AbiEi family antitoxin [Pelagicoccus enzymogenes]MDQ8199379.1 type IV toxin-antitoxin system AbiEi family antitoxin [Pelagicoccus enzymogenes]